MRRIARILDQYPGDSLRQLVETAGPTPNSDSKSPITMSAPENEKALWIAGTPLTSAQLVV